MYVCASFEVGCWRRDDGVMMERYSIRAWAELTLEAYSEVGVAAFQLACALGGLKRTGVYISEQAFFCPFFLTRTVLHVKYTIYTYIIHTTCEKNSNARSPCACLRRRTRRRWLPAAAATGVQLPISAARLRLRRLVHGSHARADAAFDSRNDLFCRRNRSCVQGLCYLIIR